MRLRQVLPRFALGLLTLVLTGGVASADEKNFKIVGAGVAPTGLPLPGQAPREHWSVGVATKLGLYAGNGAVQTDSAVFNPVNGHFTGEFGSAVPYEFEAANGDILACHYGRTAFGAKVPGTFELIPAGEPGVYTAIFLAEFVPYEPACTGRFKGAKGSWIMLAVTEPFVLGSTDPLEYAWIGQGSIKFKK